MNQKRIFNYVACCVFLHCSVQYHFLILPKANFINISESPEVIVVRSNRRCSIEVNCACMLTQSEKKAPNRTFQSPYVTCVTKISPRQKCDENAVLGQQLANALRYCNNHAPPQNVKDDDEMCVCHCNVIHPTYFKLPQVTITPIIPHTMQSSGP